LSCSVYYPISVSMYCSVLLMKGFPDVILNYCSVLFYVCFPWCHSQLLLCLDICKYSLMWVQKMLFCLALCKYSTMSFSITVLSSSM